MKFIDYAKIYVASGKGGNGHVSFRREKFVSRGGPDGGNGGKGGNVVFRTDKNLNTLLNFNFTKKYLAEDGGAGQKSRKTGKDGKDVIIKVPMGTQVYDQETGEILADLDATNSEVILAKGGRGGKGNSEFKTSTRQAPRFATDGKPGKEFNLRLELKLLANVGIVGFPNAGKSTLISKLSEAKPKIADYPFTTLIPNLGVVKYRDYDSFTVADVPGLIEGASDGKGLGTRFLKHIERCEVLLFLLDSNSEDPIEEYEILKKELENFNPEMLEKTEIITLSKVDVHADNDELDKILIHGRKPLCISSVTGYNIQNLKDVLFKAVQNNRSD